VGYKTFVKLFLFDYSKKITIGVVGFLRMPDMLRLGGTCRWMYMLMGDQEVIRQFRGRGGAFLEFDRHPRKMESEHSYGNTYTYIIIKDNDEDNEDDQLLEDDSYGGGAVLYRNPFKPGTSKEKGRNRSAKRQPS